MPRYGPFIHQVYIADGFADDCDELIHRCLNAERFDYQVFCQIWKEMNMGCLYEGRTLGAEIAELSEEAIHIGKHYMLKNTSNFEENAIGVFIVYALLHLQPYQGFACLRVVPEDLPAINRIEQVARRDKRYDVLYALGSILIKGPVEYHAAEREYGMDLSIRKYLEGFTTIDKLGVRPKGVFRRQNEELDILRELDVLTQKYQQAKMMISEEAQYDRGLAYINPNVPKILETALLKLINGIYEEKYELLGQDRRDGNETISRSRRAIKERAMKQDVKPVRHLEDIKNLKTSTVTSGRPKEEDSEAKQIIKESPRRRTRNKKDKVSDAKSLRKRRIPISPRALKRNEKFKMKVRKESTSENDEYYTDVIDPAKKSDDERDVSRLPETIQAPVGAKKKKNKNNIKNEDENEQELDIEIDTLPVLIRTEEHGKLVEIEIIDNKAPAPKPIDKPMRTYKKKESAFQKICSMPGISLKKITEPEVVEPVPSTSAAVQFSPVEANQEGKSTNKEEVAKSGQDKPVLGIPNSKPEKRNCKRVHLQSKFKRLGMLPMANFESQEDIVAEETMEEESNDDSQGELGLSQIED